MKQWFLDHPWATVIGGCAVGTAIIWVIVHTFVTVPAPEVAKPAPTFQCPPCPSPGVVVPPKKSVPSPVPAPRVERPAAPPKAAPKPSVKIKKLDPNAPIDCGKVAALRAKVPADVILAAVDRRLTKSQGAQVRACLKR